MNLNYNINNTLAKNRNFFLGKVGYVWQRIVSVAAGPQSGSIIFGSGSITYTPYAPTTLFVSGTYQADQVGSGSALGIPVALSVTGSGVWPTTGSNVLYINVGGNLGFNNNTSSIFTAAAGNMNLSSGSKISSSFVPIGNQEYNIDFGVTHTKGNIYNPNVNVLSINGSPSSPTNVNGYSSSFNVVKDVNVPLISTPDITGSKINSFAYQYNFGVTSSLTSSIQSNATGSTTMSLSIPEAGVFTSSIYFNPTSAGTKIITASFAANNDNPYNITASVIYNKGNISNSKISYFTSASHEFPINLTASFNIVKNANETIVDVPFLDGIISGSTTNNYAFSITASFSSSWTSSFSSASQAYYFALTSYSASQFGYFTSSYNTSSFVSTSFSAQSDIIDYQFTASVKEIALPAFSASFIVIGGGGGGSAAGGGNQVYDGPGAGGGAGGWTKIDLPVVPLFEYKAISLGVGGVAGLAGVNGWSGGEGSGSIISYWLNNQYFTASVNGGGGGLLNGTGGTSGNGFSGSAGGGGTVSGSTDRNGGLWLGGGQGVLGIATNPLQPSISLGSVAPIINLPTPNQIFTASMSGSGGNGGWYGPNGVVEQPATDGTFGGGGGGGGNGFRTTSRPGSKGGAGALIIIYQGAPKLTIQNGYTDYIVPSVSGSDYTVHYITGSNSTIQYLPY